MKTIYEGIGMNNPGDQEEKLKKEKLIIRSIIKDGGRINSWELTKKLLKRWVEGDMRIESIEFDGKNLSAKASERLIAIEGSEKAADAYLEDILESKVKEEHSFVKDVLAKYNLKRKATKEKIKSALSSLKNKFKSKSKKEVK